MLLASLALSTAAFAADAGTAFSLKGQARLKKGDGYTLIAVGNGIAEGSFIQVGAKATLGLKLVDGSTAYFGPNSSFRLKFKPDSGPGSTEITLLSGSVAGDFTSGAALVVTASGVINLSGTVSCVSFAPGQTGGGALSVACSSGTASVTTTGSTTSSPVAAGQQLSVAPSASGTPMPPVTSTLSAAQVQTVGSATTGNTSALTAVTTAVLQTIATGASTVTTIPTPAEVAAAPTTAAAPPVAAPAVVVPNLAVVSPNGEGQQP
jgi:hypothetical protein